VFRPVKVDDGASVAAARKTESTVQSEPGSDAFRIISVALEAVLLKDGLNLLFKKEGAAHLGGLRTRGACHQHCECHHA